MIRDVEEVARAKGMQLPLLKARTEMEIETAFANLPQLHARALVVGTDAFYLTRLNQLVTLAARYSVPASRISLRQEAGQSPSGASNSRR